MAVAVAQTCDIGPIGFVGNWMEDEEHLRSLSSVRIAAVTVVAINEYQDQAFPLT